MKKNKILFIFLIMSVVFVLFFIFIFRTIKNNIEEGKKINLIMIHQMPQKTVYYVGEAFDENGLIIQVVLNNGDTYNVESNDVQLSGFDSSKVIDKQEVIVEYNNFSCVFYVIIKELPQQIPILSRIELDKLPKTEYKVGEWLDTSGVKIIRIYSDGSTTTLLLTNQRVYGYTKEMSTTPGTYTLTVKYVENGILAETTFDITVTE